MRRLRGGEYMEVMVDDIKNSLRIDVTDDDDMIQHYIDTAHDYVTNAVNPDSLDQLKQENRYWFAVSLLAQFQYQNRAETDMKDTPYQVRSLIQQLRGL